MVMGIQREIPAPCTGTHSPTDPDYAQFSNRTQTSIQANWTANGNPSGTDYYCENVTNGTNSGWITGTSWNSTGLACGTRYEFRVMARNGDNVNTTWTALDDTSTTCLQEDCLNFNPKDVYIVQEGSQWLLTDGIGRMLMFPNQEEAIQGRETIQYYGMNSQCFIGRPDPSMEYWLVNGSAPSGSLSGEDCINFDPTKVYIVQEGSQWLLTDGSMRMLTFPNQEEAIQGLETIQYYGFSYQCFIGRPDSSMRYWRR